MECTGKLENVDIDFKSRNLKITFLLNENDAERVGINNLISADVLDIKASKHRKKRSLDANAYFHVLVGKIADSLSPPISKARCKNMLICKYGKPQLLPDGEIMVYKTNAPEEFMWEQESVHCIPVKYEDKATFYKIYRGSHTYDTKEMSILIDGTVEEAKDLGIDTVSPTEIEEMKQRWGVKIEKAI